MENASINNFHRVQSRLSHSRRRVWSRGTGDTRKALGPLRAGTNITEYFPTCASAARWKSGRRTVTYKFSFRNYSCHNLTLPSKCQFEYTWAINIRHKVEKECALIYFMTSGPEFILLIMLRNCSFFHVTIIYWTTSSLYDKCCRNDS